MIQRVIKYFGVFGGWVVVGMIIITMADIIGRALFRYPFPDGYDIVSYLFSLSVLLSMGYCQQRKQNVRIGLLIEKLPPRARLALDTTFYFMMAILIALVAWRGWVESMYQLWRGSASTMLKIPEFPFHFFVPIGCLLMFIQLFLDLISFSKTHRKEKGKD